MARILVVDDEPKIGSLLASELTDAGHEASSTPDPEDGLNRIRESSPDILITDLRMDKMDGITLMKRAKEVSPSTDVVVMTAYASLETALETMREGAYDYIIKPFGTEALLMLVARLEESRNLREENEGLRSYIGSAASEDIIGESPLMETVRRNIQSVGPSNASVLIRGESGTGKELVAKAIHKASARSEGPFIALNCAAIPEALLESELFGHEQGAFTGASRKKLGHFQLANGGTLFLDEIGDLPGSLQPKLLRVLEDKKITPVGGEKEVQLDIRLVSATHRILESTIDGGAFRQDLYYRLNVFPIVLPPLRERAQDIAPISTHLLKQWGRAPEDLGPDALQRLSRYEWPGNIRELRNVLERSTILCPTGTIAAEHILTGMPDQSGSRRADVPGDTLNLAEAEKQLVIKALARTHGNKSEAARLLGITRRALYGRLERYGLE